MKKNIFLWSLYDFANTPLSVALTGLYLAQWIVLDNKVPDIWYSSTFMVSTILLLFTSPFWGAWSDKIGKRMPFIKWTTIFMILFGIPLFLIAPSSLPTMPKVVSVLILFLILQYLYQISLIFYDALLIDISTPKNRGKISGIGRVFGEAGWLIGPAILLPFATGVITIFGTPGRSQVFLPAIVLLLIFSLPMLLWFKEPKREINSEKQSFRLVYAKTIHGLKKLIREDKNVTLYLIAFMLISDALMTSTLVFGIFLDQIYHITDSQKVIVLTIAEVVAIASAYITGRLSDTYGQKKTLVFSCVLLILAYFLITIFSSLSLLYIFVVLLGAGLGGFYPTARAFLVKISPVSQLGEYFGFYSTFERFASIIGPMVWGITTLVLHEYGPLKYRVSILLLVILMIIGTLLLLKVKETQKSH